MPGQVQHWPVNAPHLAREERANLFGAERDEHFGWVVEELVDRLAPVRRELDADLAHDLDGEGVDVRGPVPCAPRLHPGRSLGHLAPRRVLDTHEQQTLRCWGDTSVFNDEANECRARVSTT